MAGVYPSDRGSATILSKTSHNIFSGATFRASRPIARAYWRSRGGAQTIASTPPSSDLNPLGAASRREGLTALRDLFT